MSLNENNDKPAATENDPQGFLDLGPLPVQVVENQAVATASPVPASLDAAPLDLDTEPVVPTQATSGLTSLAASPVEEGDSMNQAEPIKEAEPMNEAEAITEVESSKESGGSKPRKSAAKSHATSGPDDAPGLPPTSDTDAPSVAHPAPASVPIPAARVAKRRGRSTEPAALAEPDLAHALAGVAEALEMRPAASPSGASSELFKHDTEAVQPSAAAAITQQHDESSKQAVPPSFEEIPMPIAVEDRTVKLAAWLLALTAGFAFVTMVCAIWSLSILMHPPVAAPVVSPLAAAVPSDPLASAVAALAPAASMSATSAASAPAVVRHHHHHKPKVTAPA